MQLRHFLFLCLIGGFFVSCKSSTSPHDDASTVPDSSTVQQLFPLAYGNYWHNQIDNYDKNNTVYSTDFEVVEVIDTVNFRGQNAFVLDYGQRIPQVQYFSGPDLFRVMGDKDSVSEKALHYPLSLGEQYTLNDYSNFLPPQKYVIAVKNFHVPVSVPAGNFSCVEIEVACFFGDLSTASSFEDDYYAPNVGLVKSEFYDSVNGGAKQFITVRSLLDYRVK